MNTVVDSGAAHLRTGFSEEWDRNSTLIDDLLAEQRQFTAVESFSHRHESLREGHPAGLGSVQGRRYQALLPAAPPGAGQQYAFEVDLDRCSGCKACVTACHSLNGLDDDETWRSVGLLISPARGTSPAAQLHVTTACHHCVDPACLNGCPVLAYDKDPGTGIVRHLDDQCMGCSYCVMKCPYEVPRYSERLGIVRKCDLCQNRLSVGEAPACAQACPNEAIRISVVDQNEVRERYRPAEVGFSESERVDDGSSTDLATKGHGAIRGDSIAHRGNLFLPSSPGPGLTLPTTRYVSRRKSEALTAADEAYLRLEPAHGPLVAMLVLTQASAGLWLASLAAGLAGWREHFAGLNGAAFVLLTAGLAASVLHLGRPSKAWRAFLGWRRSWLSREILAFQAGTVAAVAAVVSAFMVSAPAAVLACTGLAALVGLAGVIASSMVYVDTGRPIWGAHRTFGNFLGTTLLLGAALGGMLFAWLERALPGRMQMQNAAAAAAVLATIIRTALFAWRQLEQRRALERENSSIHWNARVVRDLLPGAARGQWALFVVSTVAGLTALCGPVSASAVWATVSAGSTLLGEGLARTIFFVAGGARRMPGGLPS